MPSPSSAARGRNPRAGTAGRVQTFPAFFRIGPEQGNWPGSEITFILINFILVIFVKCVIICNADPVRPTMSGVWGGWMLPCLLRKLGEDLTSKVSSTFLKFTVDNLVISVILLT